MRIVFMGSPEFAVPSLKGLQFDGHEIALVVCQPDKPAGRGRGLRVCPVKTQADALGIEVICPERIRGKRGAEFRARVEAIAPDFLVVAAYGKILPKSLLAMPRVAPVNVHASLLPRWRGASPIHHAVLAGDAESGVCVMHMTPGMDEGGVYAEVREPIAPGDTTGSLSARLAQRGAEALRAALPEIAAGKLTATPQPEEVVTLAPMLQKEDGLLDFSQPARALERRVRAMDPWPGAYTSLAGAALKVFRAAVCEVFPGFEDAGPGTVVDTSAGLIVACQEGALNIEELQLAGKKRMRAVDYLRGARVAPGAHLGA